MRRENQDRYPSPQNDRRGCLCKDGTYSRKCCDGSFYAQGIGSIIIGDEDSSGTIVQIDTTDTTSSESTALPSQSSSTVDSVDTTSTSSTTTNDEYYDTSQGTSTIVNIDTTNTVTSTSGDEEPIPDPATIDGIAITAGSYAVGDTLPLVVTYTDTVTVDTTGGTPSIDVDLNTNTRTFNYSSGSTTNQLTFNYSLQAGDTDITSATASSTIDLNGGTITDSNGISTSSSVSTTNISLTSIDLPSSGTPSSIEEINDGSSLVRITTGYQETTSLSSIIYFSGTTTGGYEIFDIQNISDITDRIGEVMYRFRDFSPIYIMSDTIQVGAEVKPENKSIDQLEVDSLWGGIDFTIPKYWAIYFSSEYLTFGYDNGTDTVVYVKLIIRVQENVNGKLIITAIYENQDAEGDQWVIS